MLDQCVLSNAIVSSLNGLKWAVYIYWWEADAFMQASNWCSSYNFLSMHPTSLAAGVPVIHVRLHRASHTGCGDRGHEPTL